MKILFLSTVSGLLSYLSVSLPHLLSSRYALSDDMFFVLPGVLFGLFNLLPQVAGGEYRAIRRIGLLLLSTVAWYVAVSLGLQALPLIKQSPILSCGLSGIIGVLLLALISRSLVPVKLAPWSIASALCAGFFGGCIIGLAFTFPRASFAGETLYFFGFWSWHCGVAYSLFAKKNPFVQNNHPATAT